MIWLNKTFFNECHKLWDKVITLTSTFTLTMTMTKIYVFINWLIFQLTYWQTDKLNNWFINWLIDCSIVKLVDCSIFWSIVHSIDQFLCRLIDGLIECFIWWVRLIEWLIDLLFYWCMFRRTRLIFDPHAYCLSTIGTAYYCLLLPGTTVLNGRQLGSL